MFLAYGLFGSVIDSGGTVSTRCAYLFSIQPRLYNNIIRYGQFRSH